MTVVGTRMVRKEDPELLTGEWRFVDDLTIPGAGIQLTAPDLSVTTVTSGRTIDLGTAGVGTFMGLDAATLGKLSIANSLAFSAPGGTIQWSATRRPSFQTISTGWPSFCPAITR